MLEISSILSSERGCFPGPSEQGYNRLLWRMYSEGLRYLLEEPDCWFNTNILNHIKKTGEKSLKELDRTFELIRNYNTNNNSDPWSELFFDKKNNFPKKSDIHVKFFELITNYMADKGIMDKKVENIEESQIEFDKIHYNLIIDCRRVIDYILNDKPLYLIPQQVRTFRKFTDILSEPPKKERYYYI